MIDAEELGRFNPLTGHGGNGESKIYESLYAVPVLAEGAPEPVDGDLGHWRVRTPKDGTPFGSEDVAATYNAIVDPKFAFLLTARVTGPDTVDFLRRGRRPRRALHQP